MTTVIVNRKEEEKKKLAKIGDIYRNDVSGLIILVIKPQYEHDKTLHGVTLSSFIADNPVIGVIDTNWNLSNFKLFKGEIILKSE